MTDKDTIIIVAVTRKDEYGNLWVTPQGDGDEIKIAGKREHLHSLFEQGKAVMLHWETYMDKPYVANAKLVEGELPKPKEPKPPTGEYDDTPKPAPQEIGMWWKEMGNRIGDGSLERDFPHSFIKIKTQYYKRMSAVTGINFWKEQE